MRELRRFRAPLSETVMADLLKRYGRRRVRRIVLGDTAFGDLYRSLSGQRYCLTKPGTAVGIQEGLSLTVKDLGPIPLGIDFDLKRNEARFTVDGGH